MPLPVFGLRIRTDFKFSPYGSRVCINRTNFNHQQSNYHPIIMQKHSLKFGRVENNLYICSVFIPKPRLRAGLMRMETYIQEKALSCALCLTFKNLAVQKLVKRQSNNDAHGYVISVSDSYQPSLVIDYFWLYIYIQAWASALLVSDQWAMPEPLNVGRVTDRLPRFFFVYQQAVLL